MSYSLQISVIHHQDDSLVVDYMTRICDQSGLSSMIDFTPGIVNVSLDPLSNVREVLDRLLEDYQTLGMDLDDGDVDIYDLVVFCQDPMLNAYYTQSRMNISHCGMEAISEIINDYNQDTQDLRAVVEQIDVLNLSNGVYKLRPLLQTMSEVLEGAGIPVAEKMNQIVKETLH